VNCGIRIQGGASRNLVLKHGLRVLFKNIYGPGKLDYALYPGSPVQEFDTLTLHATFNDHWLWGGQAAQMIRDQWCRDAQNAMGGYGPHGTYAHVYLNGLYWGLYNIGEKATPVTPRIISAARRRNTTRSIRMNSSTATEWHGTQCSPSPAPGSRTTWLTRTSTVT
jgi:hypothetical protein